MAAANYLPDVLETTEPERLATGFVFTEGPLWHPDGYWYFVDKRIPYQDREIAGPPGTENLWDGAAVYRLAPEGTVSLVVNCEYPNGLAFSPDERTLYVVANTRSSKDIHAIELDAAGRMTRRRISGRSSAAPTPRSTRCG
ncbi:MAG: SMP-30/gluconolactonase/LRE family protein [Burkholderiales bacterium]|nr:SMP-30/gluconolactonase/LRE family protein [Burkholderiales bacterium]